MATIKSQGAKKFSKSRTDIDVPSISRPENLQMGMSLTGSADIDNTNPENLYFHIFSSMLPQRIDLYLYGERFSQIHYTEFPQHNHATGTLVNGASNQSFNHTHVVSVDFGAHNHGDHYLNNTLVTPRGWLKGAGTSTPTETAMPNATHGHAIESDFGNAFGPHEHALLVGNSDSGDKIDIDGFVSDETYRTTLPSTGAQIIANTQIETRLTPVWLNAGFTSNPQANNTSAQIMANHIHTISGSVANLGILPGVGSVRTSGSPKQYFDAMKIAIDGVDKTALLLTQAGLVKFGDGTSGHSIVTTGVVLNLVPFISIPGQHKITFSLNTGSPNNGGKIRYNLYTIA